MKAGKRVMAACAITLPIGLAVVVPSVGAASSRPAQTSVNAQAAAAGDGQFVAVANSDADYAGLKADVQRAGGRVVKEMPEGPVRWWGGRRRRPGPELAARCARLGRGQGSPHLFRRAARGRSAALVLAKGHGVLPGHRRRTARR